jgi:hypothetical protein
MHVTLRARATQVENTAAEFLATVARVLTLAGVYTIISFRNERLLRKLLECQELPFAPMEHTELPAMQGDNASFCRVRRRSGCAREPDLEALRARIDNVVDWWYREQSPLLTRARKEEIHAAWTACARKTAQADVYLEGVALPLHAAFEILLTAEERTELSFEDFLGDLCPFLSAYGGTSDDEGPTLVTLHQALEFLENVQ